MIRRKFHIPLLSLLLLGSNILCSCSSANSTSFSSVEVEEFAKVITTPHVQLVDVRTPEEFSEGNIPSSINIDIKNDNFMERATAELKKAHPVAVYCRSGRRSKIAAQQLHDAGYIVIELNSGFLGWKEANL